jgi:L-threonylcarbamoyladenylate synthase
MTATLLKDGPEAHARAAALLRKGRLVALPTETVYGLAADARSDAAIAAIYAAKGRPSHNPLITHLLRPQDAERYAEVSALADTLRAAFWPGSLTLVLPRKDSDLAARAGAGLDTIALRCPDAVWRDGLVETGWNSPLVMPSANLSGHVSPTTAAHVMADLGERIALIIDAGPCPRGVESTVVRIDGETATLLRSGAVARSDIEVITGPLGEPDPTGPLSSPGMLARHYAPEASLRLNADEARGGEVLIGFGRGSTEPTLSASGDLEEAARTLYALLRKLDGPGVRLAVAPIPDEGLGAALNDRLRRAALGR